jgi:hypothetical protein
MASWDDAERHFKDAIDLHERTNARPFLARTQQEYGQMLLARGRQGDNKRAEELFMSAFQTAEELGMRPLLDRLPVGAATSSAIPLERSTASQ